MKKRIKNLLDHPGINNGWICKQLYGFSSTASKSVILNDDRRNYFKAYNKFYRKLRGEIQWDDDELAKMDNLANQILEKLKNH